MSELDCCWFCRQILLPPDRPRLAASPCVQSLCRANPLLVALFGLLGAEGQVVIGAPCPQVLDLLPVGQLVVDEANHRCVVCKLGNGIGTMYRCAVVGAEGIEEWAQHTALWDTSVQGEGRGSVVFLTQQIWACWLESPVSSQEISHH